MKKCPYCAEQIQDEAIICRYCGRDLPPSANPTDIDPATLPIETEPSFSDIMQLGAAFARSAMPSAQQHKEIFGLGSGMVKEVIAPVFDKYIEYRVIPQSAINEELKRVLDHAYVCSLACFGIGVEEGAGNLQSDRALNYLQLINHAFGTHLVYFLGKLIESGVMSQRDAVAQAGIIQAGVGLWTSKIKGLGSKQFASVHRTSSEFLDELRKLEKLVL